MKENVNVPKYKDFENCDPTTPIVSPFLYLALTNLVDVARHTKTIPWKVCTHPPIWFIIFRVWINNVTMTSNTKVLGYNNFSSIFMTLLLFKGRIMYYIRWTLRMAKIRRVYGRFDHVTTRFKSPYISKNGILFVIFPFDTNLNFSWRQIRLSILGCLGDVDNTSLSKWLYEKSKLLDTYY